MNKIIQEFHQSLKNGEIEFNHNYCSIPGVRTLEVVHKEVNLPVATIWYTFKGNSGMEILQSFVIESARRCSLRTFCHRYLIESYPHITYMITCSANRYSKPWLLKNGFKIDKNGDWFLKIKRK